MFRSKNEGNIVYKCTVRLLDDSDVLECEFQVCDALELCLFQLNWTRLLGESTADL